MKGALYVGVGLATWFVMRSGANGAELPEAAAEAKNVRDYASWEPES